MKLLTLALCSLAPAPAAPPPVAAAPPTSPGDRVDDLVQRGRAHLDKGELDQALELFTQADVEAKGALRSRMWVLRVWFLQGRINDAFDEVDRLAATNEGPDFDYLYGMGSYIKARTYLSQGVQSNMIGFAFQDAERFLASAVAADGARFYDAWYPLAAAAFENSHLDVAESAVAQALERAPEDAETLFLAGRVAFQLSNQARAEEGGAERAREQHDRALDHLGRAARALGESRERSQLLADVFKEMAFTEHYAQNLDEAARHYAEALAWNPNVVAIGDLWSGLELERFLAMLERAEARFVEHWGEATQADATLLWWLGSAYLSAQKYEECEKTYQKVLAKWPAYSDSHFYIGLARYYRGDYEGTILAWHEYSKVDRPNLVALLSANKELYVPILSYLLGQAAEKAASSAPEFALHAQFLSELRCDVDPDNWVHHNDLGLFSRDAGDFLRRRGRAEDEAWVQRLYEQAARAYERAMDMAPDKPHLPNDLAVIFDYCLERDYPRAMELYERSLAMATALLEKGGLSEEDQLYAETAKRDSANNIAKLKRKLEKQKEGGEGSGDGTDGGDGR